MSDDEVRVKRIIDVKAIVLERDEARTKNNYVQSDTLRDKLKGLGVELIDQKGGPSGWKFTDGTSKKLPAGSNVVVPSKKRTTDSEVAVEKPSKKLKSSASPPSLPSKSPPVSKKVAPEVKKSAEQERNKLVLQRTLGVDTGVKNVQGVLIEEVIVGNGKKAETGKKVKVYYSGKLKSNGKVFDASLTKPFAFRLGRSEVIKGWDIGVAGMLTGGKRRITCPPEKAYGRVGAPPTIPSNATLIFDVTLIDVI
jgi:FK506-binding nuclear protein